MLDGRILDLTELTDEERAYFERCVMAYRDGVSWEMFNRRVEGMDNPLVRAAGGRITDEVWNKNLFRAVRDLEDRLGIQQGEIRSEPGHNGDEDLCGTDSPIEGLAGRASGSQDVGLRLPDQ
jgi:hypothetical protein